MESPQIFSVWMQIISCTRALSLSHITFAISFLLRHIDNITIPILFKKDRWSYVVNRKLLSKVVFLFFLISRLTTTMWPVLVCFLDNLLNIQKSYLAILLFLENCCFFVVHDSVPQNLSVTLSVTPTILVIVLILLSVKLLSMLMTLSILLLHSVCLSFWIMVGNWVGVRIRIWP